MEGKAAIVTGGGSGLGVALVEGLARAGARVWMVGRSADRLQTARARLLERGLTAEAAPGDVTDCGFVASVVERVVSQTGRLDYLFNNAGTGLAGQVRDLGAADWRRMIDVNLYGVINGVAAAYPVMRRQRSGHIVNTASLAGLVPMPGMVPYVAAKHAVVGLSLALRAEAAPHGVVVTVVCPAAIRTPLAESAPSVKLDTAWLRSRVPLAMLSADDCAMQILRGVRAGAPVVAPGPARWLALLERYAPAVTRRMGRSFARAIEEARNRHLASTERT